MSISVKLNLDVVQEMLFKDISYLELWQPPMFGGAELFVHFGRGHHEDIFFEIILHLDQ